MSASSTTQSLVTDQDTTISAAPALLPDPPLLSPYSALSPDITPLFPSPLNDGGSTSSSPVPTIPSTRSPPNPDTTGPDAALAPTGNSLLQDSSAAVLLSQILRKEGFINVTGNLELDHNS
ncbi:hypothetical protein ACJIZ3_018190 [Penstemon smallii]|uniref:Uncharacterized protein n=1 Tax=Penstemon smallii TaxID=265156 RepID=A0ABD3SY66_9LAMI